MSDKYKIVALFGKAGAGKDYLLWHLTNCIYGRVNFHKIVSNTTRPPREGERDGVNYHFLPSGDDFLSSDRLRKYLEFTCFRDWWYGTSIDNLDINKINIGTFNINGINQLLDCPECNVLPILISAPGKVRLIRQLEREINVDCNEICRRFQTDEKDFLNIPFSYKVVENNTNEVQPVIHEILTIIRDSMVKTK